MFKGYFFRGLKIAFKGIKASCGQVLFCFCAACVFCVFVVGLVLLSFAKTCDFFFSLLYVYFFFLFFFFFFFFGLLF